MSKDSSRVLCVASRPSVSGIWKCAWERTSMSLLRARISVNAAGLVQLHARVDERPRCVGDRAPRLKARSLFEPTASQLISTQGSRRVAATLTSPFSDAATDAEKEKRNITLFHKIQRRIRRRKKKKKTKAPSHLWPRPPSSGETHSGPGGSARRPRRRHRRTQSAPRPPGAPRAGPSARRSVLPISTSS